MKSSMSPKTLALLLATLGILALVMGGSSMVKRSKYTPVEATITAIESEYDMTENQYRYRTFVKYFVDGKKYEEELGYHEDGFEEGKVIDIRYNPADPTQIEGASLGFTLYLVIIGPLLIIGAIYLFIKERR